MRRAIIPLILLIALIALSSCHARQRATFWMAKYKLEHETLYTPESLPKLIEATKDRNGHIRIKALNVLGKFEDNKDTVIRAISEVVVNDNNPTVRKHAVKKLINFDSDLTKKTLLLLMRDGSYFVRIEAIESLNALGYTGSDFIDSLRIIAEKDPYRDKRGYPVRASAQKILSNIELASIIEGKPLSSLGDLNPSGLTDIPNFFSVPRQNDLAIIIGIEKYLNIRTKADYARNDASLVKQYLLALGFQERNIEYLINERATGLSIRKAVEAWLPNRAKKDSRIFIYYSGHGAPDSKGAGYLVPYDGDPNYIKITGYPMNELISNLQKVKAHETILVVDACFSGAGGKSVIAEGTRPLVLEIERPKIEKKNIALLSSSKMNQISTASKDKQHGLFTYYFLRSLQEGKLTIDDIYAYVKNKVENDAKKMNVEQTPYLIKPSRNIKGDFSLR